VCVSGSRFSHALDTRKCDEHRPIPSGAAPTPPGLHRLCPRSKGWSTCCFSALSRIFCCFFLTYIIQLKVSESSGKISHEFLKTRPEETADLSRPTSSQSFASSFSESGVGSKSNENGGHVIGSSVPGYTGHIPFKRAEVGSTFASSGLKASIRHETLQGRLRSQTLDFHSTKTSQIPLSEVPPAERHVPEPRIPEHNFTPRVYTRSFGVVPHSTIHLPQRRYRDIGRTYGAASRDAASIAQELSPARYMPEHDRVSPSRTLVPTMGPSAKRQWIV
jgi:hypothetical protein